MNILQDKYEYLACIEPCEEGGFCVSFPDLPEAYTDGKTLQEALYMARDVLELTLYSREQDNEEIPTPSKIEEIKKNNNCLVTPITAHMDIIRNDMKNKVVNTTVTLPKWLKDKAIENKVNFSSLLQVALKEYLGIED